jgi:hypothetical protein
MPAKHIVIVGAGPVGLYTAIKFHQRGIPFTLIDPRLGEYTRLGVITHEVFNRLKEELGDELGESIIRSYASHIKDAERSLFTALTKLVGQDEKDGKEKMANVSRSQFVGFAPGGIKVKDESGVEKFIECDLALDSTGARRVLVSEINKQSMAEIPPFKVDTIGENPIPDHFVAFVKFDPRDAEQLDTADIPNLRSIDSGGIQYASAMRELWDLGWPHTVKPGFQAVRLVDTEEGAVDKGKMCCYFETPPNLAPENQDKWFKAILKLYTGMEKDFTKMPIAKKLTAKREDAIVKKPTYLPIRVTPDRLTSSFIQDNGMIPDTFAMGDTLITPDYRLGVGIISGIERANILLNAMVTHPDGSVEIDFEKYQTEMSAYLASYETILANQDILRLENIINQGLLYRERHEDLFKEASALGDESAETIALSALKEFDLKAKNDIAFVSDYISRKVERELEKMSGSSNKEAALSTLTSLLSDMKNLSIEIGNSYKDSAAKLFPCDATILEEIEKLQKKIDMLDAQVKIAAEKKTEIKHSPRLFAKQKDEEKETKTEEKKQDVSPGTPKASQS